MQRRKRLPGGGLGELEKIGSLETPEEQLAAFQALNKNLMLTVTDMFEENIELRELNRNVMLVVTDLYEAIYPAEEGDI